MRMQHDSSSCIFVMFLKVMNLICCISSVSTYANLPIEWPLSTGGYVRERVRQRLSLYQGVCPIYMQFSDGAEKSFAEALSFLQVSAAGFLPFPSYLCFIFFLCRESLYFLCIQVLQISDTRLELYAIQKQGMIKEGEEVALVQSGRRPIWRSQSTHSIQVRKA